MSGMAKLSDLKNCFLYAVSSKADLARRLAPNSPAPIDILEQLAKDRGNFKIFMTGEKGKQREVQEPKPQLQSIHRRVHKLLGNVATPTYLHSTVKGRSYISNAAAHSGGVAAIKIDVKKFFPSVTRVAVYNFFHRQLACRSDVAGLLADLLTYNGHLATGSCASPMLAYYCHKAMFDELAALALGHNLTMTCYVDDITMSGEGATERLLYKCHQIIASHGLRSHKMKTFSANEPRVITGVCNVGGERRVPNRLHWKIKTNFQELREAKSEKERAKAVARISGRLHAAGQIDPTFRSRAKSFNAAVRQGHI